MPPPVMGPQRTRRWSEISEIASAECSGLLLSSGKPDEFALARRIIAGADPCLGPLLVGHSGRFERITYDNPRDIARHLIAARHGLRSYRQDVRAAAKRLRKN